MLEDDFDELEIARLDDLEFHIDEDENGDSRLVLLTTDTDGDRHAIVLPFSAWQFLSDALNEALSKFPSGERVH